MSPHASGADLARQALARARTAAKTRPTPSPKPRRSSRPAHGNRDPQGLGSVLERLTAEQGWDTGLDGGSVIDQWPTLCPQYVGLVQPVHYDAATGRLELRPSSHTYAAQLRLLGGQLAKQINDKMGRVVVRTIRVLPVGATSTTASTTPAPTRRPEPEAPVKTRETASPGYRAALAAALAHRPEPQPSNPYLAEAIARQDAALRANREPESAHRDAVWELDRIQSRPDRGEQVRRAALARARQERAGTTPRRVFDVA